jgi:probable HAF family extracellular repeat protein
MKSRTLTCITVTTLLVALAAPIRVAAQGHTRYKFIDLGTFGGPASYMNNGADGILNNRGTAVGSADTSTPDPYPAFCYNPDCFVSHAFQTRNGVLTDLGALPGGASSSAFWITPNGLILGNSENGQIDPLVTGLPETHAVLWRNGRIVDLGTLDGGYNSLATAVNSRGQAVGFFTNTVPDPFSFFGSFYPYQVRAFIWQNGAMQDLGTLGGPDATANFVNERGQIAGQSYTNSTPNPGTGLPTADPFLWQNSRMLDLGSLGGTSGIPTGMNNRGQVIGESNVAGDAYAHAFLWTGPGPMQDLGTLGGNSAFVNWINEAGDIAGKADLPGPTPQNHDAALWRNGVITDLGTLPGDACANAYQVNSRGQVVGTSEDQVSCAIPTGQHAFLWENGGPMVDLNTLIPAGSSLQLVFAFAINDRGEIVGVGVPPGCATQDSGACGHAYVLIPCEEGDAACQGETPAAAAATQVPTTATPAHSGRGLQDRLRARWGKRSD